MYDKPLQAIIRKITQFSASGKNYKPAELAQMEKSKQTVKALVSNRMILKTKLIFIPCIFRQLF